MNNTRWTRTALGLIVVGAIAASGCSSEDTATGVRTSARQVASSTSMQGPSSTTEPEELSIQERASRSWAANEPQGVVDREGNEVGYFLPSVSDAASEAVRAEQVADGFAESSALTQEQHWGYQVLGGIEVHDEAGDLTGYFADGFYTPEEYAEAVAQAEPIVAAAKAARR